MRRLLELAAAWPANLPSETPHHPVHYRTMRHLRQDEVDELVEAHRAGTTVYELAKRFGVHRETIGRHLAHRGIDTKPPGLHPDDVPVAASLYRSGWSLRRIAEKFGTSDNTVRRYLTAAGVVLRGPHERVR